MYLNSKIEYNATINAPFFFNNGDIKIFENANKKYLWISQYLQIFQINDDLYDLLLKLYDYENKNYICYVDSDLIKLWTIINNLIKKNKKSNFTETEKNINAIILNISGNNCNLSCNYCFSYTPVKCKIAKMSVSDIKKTINFLITINPNPKNNTYGIVLFGGEPFLYSKLIKFLKNYCDSIEKKINKKFTFSATTNGTIVSKELINIFKDNNGEIIVSIDGPENIHNANRTFKNGTGSFKRIIENLNILDKYNINYSLRATITANCNNILETIKYFENFGKNYSFDFVFNSKFKKNRDSTYSIKNLSNLSIQIEELIHYFELKIENNELIFCNNIISALSRLKNQTAKLLNCAAGINAITINADGSLYSCQNLSNDIIYNIGSLDTGINYENLIAYISPIVDKINSCSKCWCRYLCAGNCFAEKIIMSKNIYESIESKCKLKKMLWENYINLYIRTYEANPKYLNNLGEVNAA